MQTSQLKTLPFTLRHEAQRQLADELDRQLRRAEAALCRRAFGLTACVVLRSGFDEEGAGDWQQALRFGKHQGRWGLYLESGFVDESSSLARSDLFEASLETRLLAAKKLPVLARALEVEESAQSAPIAVIADLARYADGL